MKLINLTCPNCGSQLQVDAENKQAQCAYCGNIMLIDDGVQHIQYDNAEKTGYEFEKGRQRAQAERRQQPVQTNPGKYWEQPHLKAQKKKSNIWLWVLGWIFFFPVPLTILLDRNKSLPPKVKYGIIAGVWIFVGIIGLAGGSGNNTDNGNGSETNAPTRTNVETELETEQNSSNIQEIKFSTDEIEIMEEKENSNYNVSVRVSDRKTFVPEDVEFVSDNSEIATIEFDHDALTTYLYFKITGVSPGETYVYAKSKDGLVESDRIKVTVNDDGLIDPESISIETDKSELSLGESYGIVVKTVPEDATIHEISWSSSDANVVSVDEKGIVKAEGAGTATITCMVSNDIKASCEFTVDATKRTMYVRVSHPRDDDNNIGDEWSYSNSVNGEKSFSPITLSVGDTVNVYSKYSEDDDNPDVGEASSSHTVTEEDILNGFEISMDLYVTENGGRNSGKSAHFMVKYSFSIDK